MHDLGQDRRLVGQRNAGVDVQHVGAGLDLGDGVALDGREVAGGHLRGELLAAGRVDPLADDAERLVEADDDLLLVGGDDGVGHLGRLPGAAEVRRVDARAAGRADSSPARRGAPDTRM